MKDNRHKDQIKSDDKSIFINNLKDRDFIDMMIRLETTHPDRKLNSAEHLMCSILFRQVGFDSEREYILEEMKELINDYIKVKPQFEPKFKTYLDKIEIALQKK